jgi:1,4-dihydroxy-6-naphthoate synthase
MRIRVAHSPDSDDAFMFYALANGLIDTEGFEFEHVLDDIETLNRQALAGTYEVSAVSIHAYALLADRYALLGSGASMGDGYGPVLVAREPVPSERLPEITVAIPGTLTSAALALKLWNPGLDTVVRPFDDVIPAVQSGKVDAGVVIHEGQLTWREDGLTRIVDLGRWWAEITAGLPLPLGGNVVRRDLGQSTMERLARVLKNSISYALSHRDSALDYAVGYGRGLDRDRADRFVGMYVNQLTLDYGDRGRRAVREFLGRARDQRLIPAVPALDFL